ncbi:MAG TPA: YfiR family protein [Ramlibacter sp.]|nr:YfiR family protein [Ramlibacter sp.]
MEPLKILRRAAMRFNPRGDLTALGLMCIALASGATGTAHAQADEHVVKAALLSKFGLYVEWPSSTFASPASPVNLCVAGDDPFGENLDRVVAGALIEGRNVVVRRLKTVRRDSGCHILYVGGSDAQRGAQIMDAVRGSSVLTVSDSGSRPNTGIIDFVVNDNRVRFDIDDAAAAENGLVISSKLMSLAINVKRRAPSKEGR